MPWWLRPDAKLAAWRTKLHRDPENPGKFVFYERFCSQAALDEHLATPHFKAFLAYRAAANPDPVASIVITTWRAIA